MNPWLMKISEQAEVRGQLPALQDDRNSLTFSELKAITAHWKEMLDQAGLYDGDRLVIILPRDVVTASLLLSLLAHDMVGMMVDQKTSPSEIARIIGKVKPHAVITHLAQLPIQPLHSREINPGLTTVHSPVLHLLSENEATPSDVKWLLHTSGTTGEVKAVMLSEENLLERTRSEVEDFKLTPVDRLLNCLPFSHDLGLNQLLTSIWSGAALRIKTNPLPKLSDTLAAFKITGITGTPLLWIDFLKYTLPDTRIETLRYLTISGGQLSGENIRRLQLIFPAAQIIKTYGQTETFRTFINFHPLDPSLGRVVDGVKIEITPNNELIHEGKTSMLGYLFEQRAPAQIATRDMVIQKEDRLFYFMGRIDDVIKRFEQRFHLSEVETVFKEHPEVLEAVLMATPLPEGDWRQYKLTLIVQLRPGSKSNEQELIEKARLKLSYFKIPDQVKILDSIPQTVSMKPDRLALRKLLKDKEYAES